MGRLTDKVCIVTGAGRGIGRAIAEAYAREGAKVVLTARTREQIDEAAETIQSQGGQALAVAADATKLDEVQRVFEQAVKAYGGVDIVVANAGGNYDRKRIEDGDPEAWIATVELNLNTAYYTLYAAIPHLKARGGGKIIMMGSGMGHRGAKGNSSYAVAKAGMWMLTRVAAQELAEHNIAVNEISPGPVRTELTKGIEERARASGGESVFTNPVEWIKQPEDVAPLAVFLATCPEPGPSAQSFCLNRRDV